MAICKKSAVTYAVKSGRQDVHQEVADEFVGMQRHGALSVLVAVIPPSKGNLFLSYVHDSMIGNGDAVSIATQIFKYLLRAAEGSLGVDDPIGFPVLVQPGYEGGTVAQIFEIAEKVEPSGIERSFKGCQKRSSEIARQNAHRKKEGFARLHPATGIK